MKKMNSMFAILIACTSFSPVLVACSNDNYTAQPQPLTSNAYNAQYANQMNNPLMNNQLANPMAYNNFYNRPLVIPAFQSAYQPSLAFSAGFSVNTGFNPNIYNWGGAVNNCVPRMQPVYARNNCACQQAVEEVNTCGMTRKEIRQLRRAQRRNARKKPNNSCGCAVASSHEVLLDGDDADVIVNKGTDATTKTASINLSIIHTDAQALYERLRKTTDNAAGESPNKTGRAYRCHIEARKDQPSSYICDFSIDPTDGTLISYHAQNSKFADPITSPPAYGVSTGDALTINDPANVKTNVKVGIDGLGYEEAIIKFTGDQATKIYNSSGMGTAVTGMIGTDQASIKQSSQMKCYKLISATAVECIIKVNAGSGEVLSLK